MQPAGRRFPADVVVLRQEDEEVAAVRRNAGHGVRPASHGDAVVVARRHAVARVPLHVDAAEHGVDPRRQELVHRVAVLRRRYWQVELDGLRAREVLRRADAYVAGRPSEDLPLRSQVARLGVRLEVVGQYHVGVAPDVFVAGKRAAIPMSASVAVALAARNAIAAKATRIGCVRRDSRTRES